MGIAHVAAKDIAQIVPIDAQIAVFAACPGTLRLSRHIFVPFLWKKAVNDFKDEADLILVDTPGRNWKNKWELGQLNEFSKKSIVDEIHLMLSLNMSSKDLEFAVDNFNKLKPDKFILTKLDETSTYGDIINIKQKYGKPFSYITFGQDVPEDIDKADPEILYNYLMGDFNE